MSLRHPKARKPRKDAHYTAEEMKVIGKYKEEYKEQTTRELRAHVFKNKIMVDLFNFWLDKGMVPLTEEESANRIRMLAAWVQNNWRPYSATIQSKSKLKINPINVVWQTQKEAVEDELRKILQVDLLDSKDPRYFQQRNAAAKRVIDKMTEQEKAVLQAIVEDQRAQGNPEHIRRDRAERYRDRIVRTWAQERWLDMGLATVIFTVHTDSQGRLIADVHDEVLENMGLHGKQFTEKHEAQVTELTRLFLDFMKSQRLRVNEAKAATNAEAVSGRNEPVEIPEQEPDKSSLSVKMTTHGYPILPHDVMDRELSKSDCELLIRAYLSQHYYLATNKKHRRVPYSALKEDTPAFVANNYLPPKAILKDPRNMHRDQIQSLLRHWFTLQINSGPESAFRFQLIVGPNRKRLFPEYPDPMPPVEMKKARGKQKAPRKKDKGKEKEPSQLDNLLTISRDDTPNPSASGSRTLGQHAEDLVTVNMGQMMKLREMGHNAMGPINGPNEGLPEYQVPKAWLDALQMPRPEIPPTPSPMLPIPNRLSSRPKPRPLQRAVPPQPADSVGAPSMIDPKLLHWTETPNIITPADVIGHPSGQVELDDNPETHTAPSTGPISNIGNTIATVESTRLVSDSGQDNLTTTSSVLGKRNPAIRSPPKVHQTRSTQKRKVVTNDDLALQEAQAFLKGGTTRRTRRRA